MNGAANDRIRIGGAARPLLVACLLFLGAIYLLQARSPLRMNTDAYRLLSMAISAYQGEGYLVDGNANQFPIGYPLVVRALLWAGLGTSAMLVLLNLMCLVVGLWALHRWYSVQAGSLSAALSVIFVLLSWVVIKHVTLPITDLLYFGLSWLSLLCLSIFYRKTGRDKWQWLIFSSLLAYLALQCRSVGLAMVPVLAVTALLHRENRQFLRRFARGWKHTLAYLTVTALLVSAAAVTPKTGWYESQFVRDGSYFQSLLGSAQDTGVLPVLLPSVGYRLLELGEIFANLPQSKFAWLLPVVYLAGLVGSVNDGYVRILRVFEPLANLDRAGRKGSLGIDPVQNRGPLAACPWYQGAPESRDRGEHRSSDGWRPGRSRVVRNASNPGKVLTNMGEQDQVVAASLATESTIRWVPDASGNP